MIIFSIKWTEITFEEDYLYVNLARLTFKYDSVMWVLGACSSNCSETSSIMITLIDFILHYNIT